jgi:hypothetical protein
MNIRAQKDEHPATQFKNAIDLRIRYLKDKSTAEDNVEKQNNLIKAAIHKVMRPTVKKHSVSMNIELFESRIDVSVPVCNTEGSTESISELRFKYLGTLTDLTSEVLNNIQSDIDTKLTFYNKLKDDKLLSKRTGDVPKTEPVVTLETRTKYFK